jgi:hypothetical protein
LRGNVENEGKATGQVIVLKMTPERVERLRRIVEIINDVLIEGTQEAAEAFIALGLVKRAWEIGYGVEFDDRDLETATTPAPVDC